MSFFFLTIGNDTSPQISQQSGTFVKLQASSLMLASEKAWMYVALNFFFF